MPACFLCISFSRRNKILMEISSCDYFIWRVCQIKRFACFIRAHLAENISFFPLAISRTCETTKWYFILHFFRQHKCTLWNPKDPKSVVLMEKWQHKVDSEFSIYLFALHRRSRTLECNFRIISDVPSNSETLYCTEPNFIVGNEKIRVFPRWRTKKKKMLEEKSVRETMRIWKHLKTMWQPVLLCGIRNVKHIRNKFAPAGSIHANKAY